MIDLTTITSRAEPITLAVRIDERRAQMLWHNAAPAATMDFEDRFESLEGDGGTYVHDSRAWADGMVMWCDGALEAITLADYETSNGFVSCLLWDVCCGPDWPGGYAVLTSRPFGR
jgi:hypothetical protein